MIRRTCNMHPSFGERRRRRHIVGRVTDKSVGYTSAPPPTCLAPLLSHLSAARIFGMLDRKSWRWIRQSLHLFGPETAGRYIASPDLSYSFLAALVGVDVPPPSIYYPDFTWLSSCSLRILT